MPRRPLAQGLQGGSGERALEDGSAMGRACLNKPTPEGEPGRGVRDATVLDGEEGGSSAWEGKA